MVDAADSSELNSFDCVAVSRGESIDERRDCP
jgi:hypothetical protein